MTDLNTIGLRHGTDKSSEHHDYLSFYEVFFAPLANKEISILEIGVLGGQSLKTWEEFFPCAKIVGADINPATIRFQGGRVTVELLDQSNIEELVKIAVKHGPFDIIIEDGSHMWEHQITSLRTLFPFVKDGGYYIVEDLQTNYGSMQSRYRGVASETCIALLKEMANLCTGGYAVEMERVEDAFLRTYAQKVQFVTFYRHACLLKKKFPAIVREREAGKPLHAAHNARQALTFNLIAHLSYVGDIIGGNGFVNLEGERSTLQGFSIEGIADAIQYSVLGQGDTSWSDWHHSGQYAGTRGRSKILVGFAVRLKDELMDQYDLRAFGRFAGSRDIVEVSNNQKCVLEGKAPLCGLQIQVAHRTS